MRPIDADALRKDLVETLRLCEQWMADAKDDETKVVSQANWFAFLEAKLRLDSAPTIDAVPVVRCKDCVYGTDRTEDFQEEDERWDVVNPIDCMMYSSDGIPDFFPKDNYCGFGERKDDDKSCDTCKHYDKWWDDIVCDGCTKAYSNWERKDDDGQR